MTTIPTIKNLVEKLKNEIRDLIGLEYLYDELRARKDPNEALRDLTKILRCIV